LNANKRKAGKAIFLEQQREAHACPDVCWAVSRLR
jgi:hypothetical protein